MTEVTLDSSNEQLANKYAYRSVQCAAGWYFWIGTLAALIYRYQYKKLIGSIDSDAVRNRWMSASQIFAYLGVATFIVTLLVGIPVFAIHVDKSNAQNNAKASLNFFSNQITANSGGFEPTNSIRHWTMGKVTVIPGTEPSTGPFEISALTEPSDSSNAIGLVYGAVSSGYGSCYLISIGGSSSNSTIMAPSGAACSAQEASSYFPTQS